MCAAPILWRPVSRERTGLATRVPVWKSSTTRALIRPSSCCLTSGLGYRIVVAFNFDVIINVDADASPLRLCIGVGIERQQERMHGRIAFRQSEEGVVPQPGHNPALDYLPPDFHFRLVSRLGGAGRNHSEAIMVRQSGIRTVERGRIAVGAGNGGFEIVRDDNVGHPTQGGQGPHMRPIQSGRLCVHVASA
jgi:hypothetical protein